MSSFPNGTDRGRVDVRCVLSLLAGVLILFNIGCGVSLAEDSRFKTPAPGALWGRDNLLAWVVHIYDTRKRSADERAQMLAGLGFKHYAYLYVGQTGDMSAFDAEIAALKKHGVNLLGWYFPTDADHPAVKQILEIFKRHDVRPELWITLPALNAAWPKNPQEWAQLLPDGPPMPQMSKKMNELTQAELREWFMANAKAGALVRQRDMPKTPQEQALRLRQETDRMQAWVNVAKPYGVSVALYNHNGWFGMMENQVAIIESLQARGIDDVGIVYNFSHARDELHDDSKNFPDLWRKIQPYTTAVNITGMRWEGDYVYPSQGDSELSMMRTIQRSGWQGPIGVVAEMGGDVAVTLRNYVIGLDWLAAELQQPGSGGSPPFPSLEPLQPTP